jgi:hypothetical protein
MRLDFSYTVNIIKNNTAVRMADRVSVHRQLNNEMKLIQREAGAIFLYDLNI